MTQLSITDSFRNLEPKTPETEGHDRLPSQIEAHLDRLRRELVSELEQLLPSLRVTRAPRRRWGWIAAAIVAVIVGMIAAQPALRIALAKHLLPMDQRNALEMGEGLLRVYPRLSEAERRTLDRLISPPCASCSLPTTTPRSPSTSGHANSSERAGRAQEGRSR